MHCNLNKSVKIGVYPLAWKSQKISRLSDIVVRLLCKYQSSSDRFLAQLSPNLGLLQEEHVASAFDHFGEASLMLGGEAGDALREYFSGIGYIPIKQFGIRKFVIGGIS